MKFLYKSEVIDYDYFFNSRKETILFLHGWGGNKFSFLSTINLLKNKFNILSITLPTINHTKEVWNMQNYCDLVINILALHNIKNPIIICHSFGFRIVLLLNQKICIKMLVVTGGAGIKKDNIFLHIKQRRNLLKLQQNKNFFSTIASKDYLELSPTNRQTFKNIVNLNLKNFTNFNCPTLLFWGKLDKDTKLWIAKKVKLKNNAKLIITNSDHFAYLKLNHYFNNEVIKFLEKWFYF